MGKMMIALDEGAFMPVRAHDDDAGLDLRTPFGFEIWPMDSYAVDTGVHFNIPRGVFGKVESKSGLNVKHGIVSCGGIIDSGYTGSVVVKLYNFSKETYTFKPGDKVAQLIFETHYNPELEVVEELGETERGASGFGSSGR